MTGIMVALFMLGCFINSCIAGLLSQVSCKIQGMIDGRASNERQID